MAKLGSQASVMAISQRRRWPPDSSPTFLRRRSSRRNSSISSAIRTLRAAASGQPRFQHQGDILLHRQAARHKGRLGQIGDAEAGAVIEGHGGDVVAVQRDGAGIGRDHAGQHLEGGGLAGAVGTQQAPPLRRAPAAGSRPRSPGVRRKTSPDAALKACLALRISGDGAPVCSHARIGSGSAFGLVSGYYDAGFGLYRRGRDSLPRP